MKSFQFISLAAIVIFLISSTAKIHAQTENPSCPALDSFQIIPHFAPISQEFTGSAWSYAMISLLEAEKLRLHHDTVKFSEMYFVYLDFLKKITRHTIAPLDTFTEGSECNSVLESIKTHGIVPSYAYSGKTKKHKYFDYTTLFKQLQKEIHRWETTTNRNPEKLIRKATSILNRTMTAIPEHFYDTLLKKTTTPKEYAQSHLKLDPLNYYSFMSNGAQPFGERGELTEPDNWWNSSEYYNLPIQTFIAALKEALLQGYTVAVSGDVTEKSYQPANIYSWYPNGDSTEKMDSIRTVEKQTKQTSDDHSWHIVGYYQSANGWWFYVKDSAFLDSPSNGYHFIHESYLIRKSVSMCMHKYAARSVMSTIIK